jgi:hypothetical protein
MNPVVILRIRRKKRPWVRVKKEKSERPGESSLFSGGERRGTEQGKELEESGDLAFAAEGGWRDGRAFDIGARAAAWRVAIFAEFAAQRAESDLEDLRCFFAVSIAAGEGGFDEFSFHLSECHSDTFGTWFLRFVVQPRPQVFG